MTRPRLFPLDFFLLVLMFTGIATPAAAEDAGGGGEGVCGGGGKRPPNILFVLLDDLGKEWVGAYGSETQLTPHADRLAAGGMKFNHAYSMPQCTPSRVTLFTGQYPWRHGWVNHWDTPRRGVAYFDPKLNHTFARTLRDAGYATAIAGKWQINDFRLQPNVLEAHGFDDWSVWTGGEAGVEGADKRYWDPYIHTREGSRTYEGRFGDDVFTDFLIDFMRDHRDKPMLLYYPMCLTHGPHTTTPHSLDATNRVEQFRGMVAYADHLLGRLVGALEQLDLRDNTIIIWTTDNGTMGSTENRRHGRLVHGGKTKLTENGINAPFIVNGPGRVPAGVVTDALTDFTDMLPTLAQLAGAKLPEGYVTDGHSIAPLILGKTMDSPRDWVMALGSKNARRDTAGRIVPMNPYKERAIRGKDFKLFVDGDRRVSRMVNISADPWEEVDLKESRDPDVRGARRRLEAIIKALPEQDPAPQYTPMSPNPWDVPPGWMPD